MKNPSFEELEKINKSRYAIVSIVSKRARRIVSGSKPLVKSKAAKPTTIAIDELMNGSLTYTMPEENTNKDA